MRQRYEQTRFPANTFPLRLLCTAKLTHGLGAVENELHSKAVFWARHEERNFDSYKVA